MTAEQILTGLIPVDREFLRLITKIIQQEPLPTNLSHGLKKAITKHGVYLYRYTQDPREHSKTLESIMASGNDLIAILQACCPTEGEPLISWDNRRELEGLLISRAKWAQEFEERRKNGTVIFMGDGKTRAN